jgi:transcriptional regulator with XRE-family HTH domain
MEAERRREVGKRIAVARVAKGWTQKQLAAALGLRAEQTVGNYEAGRRDASRRIEQIAGVLDKPVRWFFEQGPPPPPLVAESSTRRLCDWPAWGRLLADRGKWEAFGITETELALMGNFPATTSAEPTQEELLLLLVSLHGLGKHNAVRE